jgi:cold shock CspA family protein
MKMTGTIVLWHQPRAYGFVQMDGSSKTFFVHITNFPTGQIPKLGAKVEFEIGDPISLGKPPQAINATIVSIPSSAALAALSATGKETGGVE